MWSNWVYNWVKLFEALVGILTFGFVTKEWFTGSFLTEGEWDMLEVALVEAEAAGLEADRILAAEKIMPDSI